jgi:hypothetical protein
MKIKIWNIKGYKGFDNYDGTDDNNLNVEVAMDARFKKEEVEEIFVNKFSKKHRVVVIEATEIREVEI